MLNKNKMMCVLSGMALMVSACGADSAEYDSYGAYYPDTPAPQGGDVFDEVVENDFIDASVENTSTFSVDVDTASYTWARQSIQGGALPDKTSVRPEEFINFFDYKYMEPMGADPFSINLEVAPSQFGEGKHMMRVGLKGKSIHNEDIKPTNLVFLVDVSGSMQGEQKLPLVKRSLYTLLDHLRPSDTVGLVVYAGADRVVLEPTEVKEKDKIKRAIEDLKSGGGTNGEAGIVGAYKLAERAKIEGGNNRVVILTDGDFNVGKTGDDLITLIESYRAKEISLTCMGYGLGNYNDARMEQLSNNGNGNYFYVDSLSEAERVFGTELASTLEVIASDVKVQVEFNSEAVVSYRLVGYENRVLDNQDFDDDAKDAGEIGPGHTVTAYYELELAEDAQAEALLSDVRIRYKSQYGEESQLLERAIKMSSVRESFKASSVDFQFGAAVAEFAEILRGSKHVDGDGDLGAVEEIVRGAASVSDAKQMELISLIEKAKLL